LSIAATLLDGNPRNNFLQRAAAFNPEGLLNGAVNLASAGSYAYVLCARGLVVIDISDPLKPKVAGQVASPSIREPRSVVVQFRYAFITDADGFKVVDVTVPARPRLVEGATVRMLRPTAFTSRGTTPTWRADPVTDDHRRRTARAPPRGPDVRRRPPCGPITCGSRDTGGILVSSTSSWCRKARISRWSAERGRAKARSVSRSERSTETMAEKVPSVHVRRPLIDARVGARLGVPKLSGKVAPWHSYTAPESEVEPQASPNLESANVDRHACRLVRRGEAHGRA